MADVNSKFSCLRGKKYLPIIKNKSFEAVEFIMPSLYCSLYKKVILKNLSRNELRIFIEPYYLIQLINNNTTKVNKIVRME